jgi:hypothetical protein
VTSNPGDDLDLRNAGYSDQIRVEAQAERFRLRLRRRGFQVQRLKPKKRPLKYELAGPDRRALVGTTSPRVYREALRHLLGTDNRRMRDDLKRRGRHRGFSHGKA